MKSKTTIIDYGVGNLLSVARAFEHCGGAVILSSEPEDILNAKRLVLPGVGAFSNAMHQLKIRNLVDPIRDFAERGGPFLGICLGMQMMMDSSEEFGLHEGLKLIPGQVVPIPITTSEGKAHKIPHIGWNTFNKPQKTTSWEKTILNNIQEGSSTYFVHSFTVVPTSEDNRLADCLYNGRRISAVVRSENLYGCQFHPEKSGEIGLKIIRNFLEIDG